MKLSLSLVKRCLVLSTTLALVAIMVCHYGASIDCWKSMATHHLRLHRRLQMELDQTGQVPTSGNNLLTYQEALDQERMKENSASASQQGGSSVFGRDSESTNSNNFFDSQSSLNESGKGKQPPNSFFGAIPSSNRDGQQSGEGSVSHLDQSHQQQIGVESHDQMTHAGQQQQGSKYSSQSQRQHADETQDLEVVMDQKPGGQTLSVEHWTQTELDQQGYQSPKVQTRTHKKFKQPKLGVDHWTLSEQQQQYSSPGEPQKKPNSSRDGQSQEQYAVEQQEQQITTNQMPVGEQQGVANDSETLQHYSTNPQEPVSMNQSPDGDAPASEPPSQSQEHAQQQHEEHQTNQSLEQSPPQSVTPRHQTQVVPPLPLPAPHAFSQRHKGFGALTVDAVHEVEVSKRPIIYTFYNPLFEDAFVTLMSPEGDAALIEVWKQKWYEFGWQPKVLNYEDSQKHPAFQEITEQLDNSNLDGYNKMCIWRWLAMAAVGGGWMADYDTFPIRDFSQEAFPLPNDGQMTIHDNVVPDLASGTDGEWLRMAHHITKSLMEHVVPSKDETTGRRRYTVWSDMKALDEFHRKTPDMFKMTSKVMIRAFDNEDEGLGVPWTPKKCEERTPLKVKAVHFSHAALTNAKKGNLLHEGQTTDDRGKIADEWIETWKKSCGDLTMDQ
jgi:hypothetical protein